VVTAALLVAAIAISQRRRIRAELASAKRDVELEQARREQTEERGRIAREMHDVVAHSMSLVHMQASSAPFRLEGLDEATRGEFENIARSARSALSEMREVLGALRLNDDDVPLGPQPQLSDLVELALLTTRAGSPVELTIEEDAKSSSAVLQVTAYRIVQEALGNAVRHAPGARSVVMISIDEGDLLIEARNDAPGASDRLRVSPELGGRSGRGLRGMRERVEQLDGRLNHGSTPDGGFVIRARLPLTVSDDRESS